MRLLLSVQLKESANGFLSQFNLSPFGRKYHRNVSCHLIERNTQMLQDWIWLHNFIQIDMCKSVFFKKEEEKKQDLQFFKSVPFSKRSKHVSREAWCWKVPEKKKSTVDDRPYRVTWDLCVKRQEWTPVSVMLIFKSLKKRVRKFNNEVGV